MHTKPILQATTVPSFRRRLHRVFRALQKSFVAKSSTDIPDYLRKDIGLPHKARPKRGHGPPNGSSVTPSRGAAHQPFEGNPYWRI